LLLPATSSFNFVTRGIEIEGDTAHGVDVQFPWESTPGRGHQHTLAMPSLYIDKFPVSATNYSAYRKASGYKPQDMTNWLSNWLPGWPFTNASRGIVEDAGDQPSVAIPPEDPPARMANWPVTYLSLREAREYCSWAGGRLPHSWEWSYAAQGSDLRAYPWGNATCDECWPTWTNGNTFTGPEAVGGHPSGDSPFGVSDLAGNVWQYTDEIHDEHTRSVLLRGGSNYRPTGSQWYFPNRADDKSAPPCTTHNKYMLFDDRYERAGTIGFRCVYDA